MPIVARLEGTPAPGFEYVGHSLKPENASVEGPESLVTEVLEVRTEVVDIEGRDNPISTTVALMPDRGGVRIVNAETTILRVDIFPKKIARRYDGVSVEPILTDGSDYKVTFRPETVAVVLEATQEALDEINPGSITAYLDLEGMSPRTASYTVRPRVVVAGAGEDVRVTSVSASTIEVTISR